ncbi:MULTISPECIES: LysR family transcriptional regulator [Pseudomonas]|jgi:DNA-binding transcriptional LysR family regulator|uniref:LysR family transcriptional regulator n=1 Tax=Pseudomonas qingdaonensis TaxID=2056231 RepID=A0ABX8DKU1_9PSED|nr:MULTISPECIES: LysR family transcriptional regulator [Pseudomonas]KIU53492.1 LysR family transcriptional regulator [Pseudomonas putida]KTC24218.1 LysR family transcriptional regulator [Pseudomonas putida]MBG8559460.1 LysR family transcriptional regulator [Pseudomonas qingdaonensis]MCO7505780.1 LysR family transcriptional regulator [Pseudomonas sp. VE 267-6A]MCO7530616.1 LysR family transcriptional regulator [Pseudomonas sp. 2]
MREISLDRLRTLVAIADLGSFAEAARVLNLAPPTVSLHVAELEARVGGTLLSRTRGNVQPTAIGETLVERARRLLADAQQALDDVQRQVLGLAGRVRLGASTGAIAQLMPQALETLGHAHPGIDVQVAVLTSRETLNKLAEGSLDIGLVALPQSPVKGLSIEPWRRDPVMAYLPARWDCPAQVTPEWLATQPLILNDSSTGLSRLTSEWFNAAGQQPAPRIQLNYNDAIKSLVAAGYGATLLPNEGSTPLADARIVMRPLQPLLWRQLGIAHRSGEVERATGHVLQVLWGLSAG